MSYSLLYKEMMIRQLYKKSEQDNIYKNKLNFCTYNSIEQYPVFHNSKYIMNTVINNTKTIITMTRINN